jgi:hypothetical protein
MFTTEAQSTPRKEKGNPCMRIVMDTAIYVFQIAFASPFLHNLCVNL